MTPTARQARPSSPALVGLIALMLLGLSTNALAAGGAHIVDDANVEEPGVCHFETWATRRSTNTGVIVAAPACTAKSTPNLELGLSFTNASQPGRDTQTIGPAVKYVLHAADHGAAGVALSATTSWSSQTNRMETASMVVPITFHPSPLFNVNLNGGWLWTRTGTRSALFLGGQIEWQAAKKLNVMSEVFERTDGVPGGQAGMRWSPRETFDIDLLVSHGFDGTAHANATIGVTLHG